MYVHIAHMAIHKETSACREPFKPVVRDQFAARNNFLFWESNGVRPDAAHKHINIPRYTHIHKLHTHPDKYMPNTHTYIFEYMLDLLT